MSPLFRRVLSVCTLLALVVSSGATCTGWKATPEARRACCQGGGCERGPRAATTQADADSCCAGAESDTSESSPSAVPVAATITMAVLETDIVVPIAPPIVSEQWRALVPRPPSPVPKHLLLSVFLV